MPIERWEPFRDMPSLRQHLERLFQDDFFRPLGQGAGDQGWFPIDVADRDDHIEVKAEMPGLKPEEFSVRVQGDLLTVRGERKEESERKEDNWVVRERRSGSFARAIRLPAAVNSEKASAAYKDGVLTLTLPKVEQQKTQEIKVTS
jgi:HSP20 family protein